MRSDYFCDNEFWELHWPDPSCRRRLSDLFVGLSQKVQFHTKAEIEHIKADPFDLSGKVNNSSIFGLSEWRPIQTLDEMIKESLEAVENETVEI